MLVRNMLWFSLLIHTHIEIGSVNASRDTTVKSMIVVE
jgi:hypothetical protein